ncbi:MAG: HAMP domain-containing sensor histidine kinase [Pseudomonadota bacterium]
MRPRLAPLVNSTPFRLALPLVALFSVASLLGLAAAFAVTQRSFEQTVRADLNQDMAGFRAAPSAGALSQLVEAEARDTDPGRMILSYIAPNRRHYGNALIARTAEGYHMVSPSAEAPQIAGRYLALTASLRGGQLTVARSLAEIDALRDVFQRILLLSLVPAILLSLSVGLYLAQRSAARVGRIAETLEDLTGGNLEARVSPASSWPADLAQIGAKVDAMASAQDASVTALRQVSSDIAHDLKTPIQRVAVHLDDLTRAPSLRPKDRALVDTARAELDGIVSVFHSLLQITQIETGSPRARFAPVDLGTLAETFCELYEPTAAERGQTLRLIPPATSPVIEGDRGLLGQLLANLIENALRHTPDGAEVTVSLETTEGQALLAVADTGPGIPEAEHALVLRRLYRMERSRTTPGNGLGLSLVASVASVHDAELRLMPNAPGSDQEGLRVEVTFPLPHRSEASSARPAPDGNAALIGAGWSASAR